DFDMRGAPDIPVFGPSDKGTGGSGSWHRPPRIDYDPLFNPFDETPGWTPGLQTEPRPAADPAPAPTSGLLFDEPAAPAASVLVLQRRYLITPVKSGMMVIDIRRARQRIFYERYLEKLAEKQPVRQQTLFPVTLTLNAEDYLTLLEQPDLTASLGFDIQEFGGNTVVVNALPEGYPVDEAQVRQAIDGLIAALRDDTSLEDSRHLMAAKMAESAAAGDPGSLRGPEAQLLVDQLFACREPNLTPDGRKCLTILTFEDLEKKL
ncbi:MAG: hypothetical protein II408_00035, partial [Bacteroidales bacterium]|nr:hypothetical protein [Bacteroidales bacterium]